MAKSKTDAELQAEALALWANPQATIAAARAARIAARSGPPDAPEGASAAPAIAASWQDDKTRRARLTRDAVEVTVGRAAPVLFRSMAEAFEKLKLPAKKELRFRLTVKREYEKFTAGESETDCVAFEHQEIIYIFRIVRKA